MTRNSHLQLFWTIILCVATLMFSKLSSADNPAFWSISEGTNGEDVFWTSPTAVDVGFPRYGATVEFTRVEAFVGSIGVDVTGLLEETSGTAVTEGLPVTLINETLADPNSGNSATVEIGIDPNGFGQTSITDVSLGTVEIFGFPVSITRIEVDADVTVQGLVPGDFDGDLGVDHTDLGLWESSYGVDAGADTDFNGVSDGLDFLDWQRFLGGDFSLGEVSTILVPEPTTQLIAVGLLLLGTVCVRARVRYVACEPLRNHCWRLVS